MPNAGAAAAIGVELNAGNAPSGIAADKVALA